MFARPIASSLAAALLLSPALLAAQDEEKKAHFGIYTYVKGMQGDQEVPAERLKGSKVEIEEDEIELIGADGEEQFEIKYTIDEDEEGMLKVTMEIIESVMTDAVGSKAKALAKHEGDTITLIYDSAEDADYPADFTPDGPSQHLFVLKKSADAEEEDDAPDDDADDDDDKEDDPR